MTSCVEILSVVQSLLLHCAFAADASTMLPGALCPAIVMYGFVTCRRDVLVMRPATRKMHVRGPLASTQARSEPEPESARLVTSITTPLRPPTLAASEKGGIKIGGGHGAKKQGVR